MITKLTDEQRKMVKCDKIKCERDCEHCGFHPQEMARRLTGGFFVDDNTMVMHEISELNNNIIDSWTIRGLRGIRFKRRKSGE